MRTKPAWADEEVPGALTMCNLNDAMYVAVKAIGRVDINETEQSLHVSPTLFPKAQELMAHYPLLAGTVVPQYDSTEWCYVLRAGDKQRIVWSSGV